MFWSKPKEKARDVVQALKDSARQAERDKEAARLNLERSMTQLRRLTFDDRIMSIFERRPGE